MISAAGPWPLILLEAFFVCFQAGDRFSGHTQFLLRSSEMRGGARPAPSVRRRRMLSRA